VLSEKGNIAYSPELPLDESCYREVLNTDIFVLIVGGRYGTEKSDSKGPIPKGFLERYDSITKGEYKHAVEKDIPIYVLVEKAVYADYETYLLNKTNTTVNYPHVHSLNIFLFLEEILSQARNNALQQFDGYADIEAWLREQWAGLFREMLVRQSSQHQIASLASQVGELAEVNKTLRKYLEEVVSKLDPKKAATLIETESKRLEEAREIAAIVENQLGRVLTTQFGIPAEEVHKALKTTSSLEEFAELISSRLTEEKLKGEWDLLVKRHMNPMSRDLNLMRAASSLPPWPIPPRKIGKPIRMSRSDSDPNDVTDDSDD
jgi:hypothetical protein